MASERPDTAAPTAGPPTGPAARQAAGRRDGGPVPTADERAKAAGAPGPAGGAAGDTHVAGSPPEDEPDTSTDTSPDPLPVPGARRGGTPAPGGPGNGARPRSPGGAEGPGEAHGAGGTPARLLESAEADRFRERWHAVQAGFVDDPAASVRAADELAAEAADAVGRALAARRRALSEPGAGGGGTDQSDTERLRLALRDYRALLDRIVSC
ncbi:hypothetical protein AGRA3207_007807 [Actinomadura graeca]|uniref:Uncharacterized protein n=1 Tax=Actinomadura graeca TaxID=2750812 RepID=A0ABX8R5T3_9ACTN|nr:hypothetical protein [Actinomadura graeca]QXJ26188.1 hypothetical protein AGRA3207_007807 [Actinomadura graeca]